MPIRVKIERVGHYEQYPDKTFRDLLITRQDTFEDGHRQYEVIDRVTGHKADFWHRVGDGADALVLNALEVI